MTDHRMASPLPGSLPTAAPALARSASERLLAARVFAFPIITNFWPILLYLSQKVFVLPALLLVGWGDRAYRRDMILTIALSVAFLLVYLTQYFNSYDQIHFLGALSFVFSLPAINYAVRFDQLLLRRILTCFTLFNAVMGYYILTNQVDLFGLRGLNRIEGTDGVTYRVYFESASLAAVFLLSTFRLPILRIATLLTVVAFIIFLAKSIFIVALFGLNLFLPYILRKPPIVRILALVTVIVLGVLLYIYLPVIRPDLELSLRAKLFQLQVILSFITDDWSAWGWGFFLPQLSTDIDQPYQIEMQLPMLLLQLGPVVLALLLAIVLALFLSAADQRWRGIARFLVYSLVGFNNPWLFVPSWYLTCQLLFRENEGAASRPAN